MPDRFSPEVRSRIMSRIRGKDTGPEVLLRGALHRAGLRFRKHARGLPGRPDVVFPSQRIAIFVDGDFWHGYRYPLWKDRLSPFWRAKIEANRARDLRTFARLRRQGWQVLRVWEHQIAADLGGTVAKIRDRVRSDGTDGDAGAR